jgi:hypothetical protein
VIDPSGPSREGNASRYEAAGGSPTSGVNAVYDDRALAADTLSIEPPADGGEAADGEAVDDEAGRTGKRQRSRRRGRSARQRRSWRLSFFALAMAGVVALAAWALFGSRLLVVRTVQITGTRLVPRSAVLAAAGVEPGAPLIEVNAGQVASRIDAIRQVRSAQVTRSWPDRLVIVVHERSPAVAVTAPGGGWDMVYRHGSGHRAARRPRPRRGRRGAGWPARSAPGVGEIGLGAQPGSGDVPAGRRDHRRVGRHGPDGGQGAGAHRPGADRIALLRRERGRGPGDKVMCADAPRPADPRHADWFARG